ncbi:MAG: GNAT family N-acetyltransferase [Clostridiales bacterium]|nr:GNAT family N-acetyltransferase [Clostridiales bacterium]
MNIDLRPWCIEDAQAYTHNINNPNVSANLTDGVPYPFYVKDAIAFLERVLEADPAQQLHRTILVDDRVAGGITVRKQADIRRGTGMMGYFIGQPHWGQGIMTEVVGRICGEAFSQLSIHRIEAQIFAPNLGSVRVLEKNGFVQEARLRQSILKRGQVQDSLLMARLQPGTALPVWDEVRTPDAPVKAQLPGNLHLRPYQVEDVPQILRLLDNPKMGATLSDRYSYPYTQEQAEAMVSFMVSADRRENLQQVILVDGEVAGSVGISRREGVYRQTADVGYWVGEPFWGRGIMTAVLQRALCEAVGLLQVTRFEAEAFSGNVGSHRVLERCGFTRAGIARGSITKGGEILDSALYELVLNRT